MMAARAFLVLSLVCLIIGLVLTVRARRARGCQVTRGVQCGAMRIPAGIQSQTATISAVDTTHTMLTAVDTPDGARLVLSNATTVTAVLPSAVDHDVTVQWRLREFPPAGAR